jgi:hypothetical protein
MNKTSSTLFSNEDDILAEFQTVDPELARALLDLRRQPEPTFVNRIRAIPYKDANHRARSPEREYAGGNIMEKLQARNWWRPTGYRTAVRSLLVIVGFVAVVALVLATVPAVRATADQIMQRFQMEQRFGIVLVHPPQAVPAATVEDGREVLVEQAHVIPPLTLAEAQEQVPFSIPMPALLPEGLELWAARVGTGPWGESMGQDGTRVRTEVPIWVGLVFKPAGDSGYDPAAALSVDILDKTGIGGGIGVPAGADEAVMVNHNPAVFARGAWQDNGVWDDTADIALLSWEADGFTYTLQSYLLGLTRDELIQIAESIR